MRTPANHHLTHEQLCDVLLALPSEPESAALEAAHDHLRNCLTCSSELAGLRDSLALFRQAADSYATHAYSQPPMRRSSIAPSPGFRSHVVYWATAAALAVAIVLPLTLHRSPSAAPQPVATTVVSTHSTEADEALLDGIAQDLSAEVPAAMHPLSDPTAATTAASPGPEQSEQK